MFNNQIKKLFFIIKRCISLLFFKLNCDIVCCKSEVPARTVFK